MLTSAAGLQADAERLGEEASAEKAHERARRHSADELSCLAVQFPPFFVSTRGLSRPATPIERHVARYFQIVQHSIDEKLIWPLTEHTVCTHSSTRTLLYKRTTFAARMFASAVSSKHMLCEYVLFTYTYSTLVQYMCFVVCVLAYCFCVPFCLFDVSLCEFIYTSIRDA